MTKHRNPPAIPLPVLVHRFLRRCVGPPFLARSICCYGGAQTAVQGPKTPDNDMPVCTLPVRRPSRVTGADLRCALQRDDW